MAENKFEQFTVGPLPEDDSTEKMRKEREQEGSIKEGPGEALRRARKLSGQERRVAVEGVKEQVRKQMTGFAELQEEIVSFIRDNPDVPAEELYAKALQIALKKDLIFTQSQKEAVHSVLEQYAKKHRMVRQTREKYPDDAELYKHVFNRRPVGRVEVVEGPMTLYFRCFDPNDYTWVYLNKFYSLFSRRIDEKEKKIAMSTHGVMLWHSPISGLEGTLLAENSSSAGMTPENSRAVFMHEEQHAINRLFRRAIKEEAALEKMKKGRTEAERRQNLTRYFRGIRREKEHQTKNEILAYLKGGTSVKKVADYLMTPKEKKGFYDYFHEDKQNLHKRFRTIMGEEYEELISKSIHQVFEVEYRKEIEEALAAFEALRMRGYTLEQAIAICIVEPLHRWKKVAKRLIGDFPVQEKRKPQRSSQTREKHVDEEGPRIVYKEGPVEIFEKSVCQSRKGRRYVFDRESGDMYKFIWQNYVFRVPMETNEIQEFIEAIEASDLSEEEKERIRALAKQSKDA